MPDAGCSARPIRALCRLGTLAVLVLVFCLLSGVAPASAQYSLGTSFSPFTAPNQTVTIGYVLTNFSGVSARVTPTGTWAQALGNPSCSGAVTIPTGGTVTCSYTYATSVANVAAGSFTILAHWTFCDAATCAQSDTYDSSLDIGYTGPPAPTASALSPTVQYNSTNSQLNLGLGVSGSWTSIAAATTPVHGSLTIGSGGYASYTPATGYFGADSFTYTATGPGGTSSPATVSITVAPPPAPTVSAVSSAVGYDSAGIAIDLTARISGVWTSITTAGGPSHGTVSVSGGVVHYTPASGYFGADSFTYSATGPGGTSSPAVVAITVANPPAPTVSGGSAAVAYNSQGTAIDVTSRISGVWTSIATAGGPSHGTVSVAGGIVTYTPTAGYFGADSFTFAATGPGGTSAAATITLAVANPPAPTVGSASAAIVYNSTGMAIDLSSRVSGVWTSLATPGSPAHGTLSVSGGVVTYTPSAGYYGPDSFTYTATGPGGTSPPATVTITVGNPPAPTVSGSSAAVAFNSSGMAIDLTSKIAGVWTSIATAGGPGHGTASISGGVVTYTPTPGYYGADSFTFTATGPGGTSSPATIALTVATPVAPTVTATTVTVAYNSPGTAIDLTSKIGGVWTSIATAGGPSHGTVSVSGGIVTYTPTPGYFGADALTYTATGPGGTSTPATLGLTVSPPAAPSAGAVSVTIPYNSLGTATNLSGKIGGVWASAAIVGQPTHGTVTISGAVVTYTPTPSYSGADSFTYAATGLGGTSAPATVSLTVSPPTGAVGSLTVTVSATGGNATFGFTSNVPGGTSLQLATSGGSATRAFTGLAAGTYTVSALAVSGWQLTSIQCGGASQSPPTASVVLPAGGSVACVFALASSNTAAQRQEQTHAAIRSFMNHRAESMLSAEPDPTRRHNRLTGTLFGDDDDESSEGQPRGPQRRGFGDGLARNSAPEVTPQRPGSAEGPRQVFGDSGPVYRPDVDQNRVFNAPYSLGGSTGDNSGNMSFLTSLSQTARSGLGRGDGPATKAPAPFDVWVEAHSSYYTDATALGKISGSNAMMYVGADYLLSKAILVGVLAQFDWSDEASKAQGTAVKGHGWMAGPYISARLTKNLLFDARAAWGQSTNVIDPFGTYQDKFSTDRWLMSAGLTGNWAYGDWRFRPSVQAAYFSETQRAYTDSLGTYISSQSTALGRVTFGPQVGYLFRYRDGSTFEPSIALKGVWDFKKDTSLDIAGAPSGDLHSKLELGAEFRTPTGISLKGTATLEGLGERGMHAYGGQLWLNIPLQ